MDPHVAGVAVPLLAHRRRPPGGGHRLPGRRRVVHARAVPAGGPAVGCEAEQVIVRNQSERKASCFGAFLKRPVGLEWRQIRAVCGCVNFTRNVRQQTHNPSLRISLVILCQCFASRPVRVPQRSHLRVGVAPPHRRDTASGCDL